MVQQVEDTKAVIRVLPIWSTGILPGVIVGQQMFPTLQAKTMQRKVGGREIPAATFSVFIILTLTVWVAVYDRALVRPLSRLTATRAGSACASGWAPAWCSSPWPWPWPRAPRASAAPPPSPRGSSTPTPRTGPPMPMSAMRLVPQHCLTGLAEALNLIGQI